MKKYNVYRLTEKDLDKHLDIHLQVAELLILLSLLSDVSMGVLPLSQISENRISFYKGIIKYFDSCLEGVLDGKENSSQN